MTPRHLLLSALAAFIVCSPGPAAPPEGKPVLVPLWKKTTVGLPTEDDLFASKFEEAQEWAAKQYFELIKARKAVGRHLISSGLPVALGDVVICSNNRALTVFALRPTKQSTADVKTAELFWELASFRSLVFIGRDLGSRYFAEKLMASYPIESKNEILLHNTLSRTVQADDKFAICLDELEILPPGQEKTLQGTLHFDNGTARNEINAVDLDTGKLSIKLHLNDQNVAGRETRPTKFLSLPLTRSDLWFDVQESDKKVRIECRSWQKYLDLSGDAGREPKSVVWSTELVIPPTPLVEDPHRRIHAIHLVQAGDLILCPTHLGRVVAVEAKTGKIKWTHEYAPLDAKRFPTFAPEWIVVPPAVVGDKYIYAPADFPELLCLNVADGKKVWSVKKGDGLYPAVVGEQVLVVGEKTLRSLSLKDGSEQWKLDLPGLPCGRGAMLGDKYLLPVSEPKTWRGMIALVDVKVGKITEVLKPDKDEPIGNLVVHQEFLISQTLTEIAVFPISK